MTRVEAIKFGTAWLGIQEKLEGCDMYEFFKMSVKALQEESCEDEYIKVPKKALKYRTAGMVAYNAEWLKNHFDIERAVICGAQEPVLDKIRAEIEQLPTNTRTNWDGCCPDFDYPEIEFVDVTKNKLLEIIDKYRGESEIENV